MNEQKLIPAPLDEKNVTTDWISDIFDGYGDYVECQNRNCGVGFVNDCPVFVSWHDNVLTWRIVENNINNYEQTVDVIKKRLKEYEVDDPDIGIFSTIESYGSSAIRQKFYFKDE